MTVGEVRYAQASGAHIAYEVLGGGDRDILVMMEAYISIDAMDDEPRLAHCLTRLSSLGRVIRYDRRGVGLSDPIAPDSPPTLERSVADAMAVLDAAGSRRTVVLAATDVTPVALLAAATWPDRVQGLALVNSHARLLWDVDYPVGARLDARALERDFDQITAVSTEDHENRWVYTVAPSAADDPLFRQWWDATGRRGASPATARALLQVTVESDVRAALPAIQAPTLVVHLSDAMAGVQHGRYVADHIPHAQWVEIPGADTFWWFSDSNDMVLDQIEEFVTGEPATALTSRVLSTVLLIDIVSSTEHVATMGDVRWRGVLDRFDSAARRQLGRFRGTEVNTTGDGFVATFDGPARAVACACAIRDSAHQLGLEVRSGVHTGEIEQRGADIAGIAVHIAARVASLAPPSGVWVSRTVADLVVGSGIRFQPLGDHDLRGVPGSWTLYAVSDEEPLPT